MKKEATDKKKKLPKLNLNRETLRQLNEQDLQAAVGGATVRCSNVVCTNYTCYC